MLAITASANDTAGGRAQMQHALACTQREPPASLDLWENKKTDITICAKQVSPARIEKEIHKKITNPSSILDKLSSILDTLVPTFRLCPHNKVRQGIY